MQFSAEPAGNQVLVGSLPQPDYPPALRTHAPPAWWSRAELTLEYARTAYAARGQWSTNEKRLLDQAGLRHLDALICTMTPDSGALTTALDRVADALRRAVADP
ncbi:hypothetical protein [Plantactinospora sp. KBS50]|uniref:hypothetical protein n=1 Tax=Plantactinospora sp. KBS50 TaxID=2024580 RepID=UPI000BAAE20D|nr:hypothetical protein [Plantactinospora sp. KBS50]ASW54537.1 hypothetical protein CIK06_10580 [Plantactinospora sp. KBS50]